MKIFVSHSIKDKNFLQSLQDLIKGHDLELLIAEHEFTTNCTITEKIKQLINQADIGLVLLTKSGINSGFVREEIGFLEAKKKPTIMAIEKGLQNDYGGFKYGVNFIEINPQDPNKALERIKRILHKEYLRLSDEKDTNKVILIIIGLVLAALILGSGD